MRMDPRIIMSGQQPDFVNTLARSTQAARGQAQARDENALRQLYQTQGPGILAGEEGALNALSQVDPMAAFGVRDSIQDNEIQAGNYEMRRKEFDLRVQEYKRSISAEQAQAEAQLLERMLAEASAARTPEQWDATMARYGEAGEQYVGQFENREGVFRTVLPIKEALARDEVAKPDYRIEDGQFIDANNPQAGAQPIPNFQPKPADEYERYRRAELASGREPLDRLAFKKEIAAAGKSETSIDVSA